MASHEILPSCDMRSIPESACSSTCMTKRFKRPTRRLNALMTIDRRRQVRFASFSTGPTGVSYRPMSASRRKRSKCRLAAK